MSALGVLNRYGFQQLRPGENDASFQFSGPGLVVLACESPHAAEVRFSLITAVSADSDALAVAKSLLKQGYECNGYRFALLAPIRDKRERLAALSLFAPMCSAGV